MRSAKSRSGKMGWALLRSRRTKARNPARETAIASRMTGEAQPRTGRSISAQVKSASDAAAVELREEVEPAAHHGSRRGPHEAERHPHRDDPERHVEEKDAAPAEGADEQPAQERSRTAATAVSPLQMPMARARSCARG